MKQNGPRAPCPPWPTIETIGQSTSTFWPFFAYERWCLQARIRGTGLVSCTGGPVFNVIRIVHCRPPKSSPTARHRRSLTLHLNIQRSRWCCSGGPPRVFAVVPIVVCCGRGVVLLRGVVYDGGEGSPFPGPRSRRRRPRWHFFQVLAEPGHKTTPSGHWHQMFG